VPNGTAVLLFDIPAGRWRLDQALALPRKSGPFTPREVETSLRFDGRLASQGTRDRASSNELYGEPAVSISTQSPSAIHWQDYGYGPALWSLGRPLTQRDFGKFRSPYHEPLRTDRFIPVGAEVIDGRRCLLLRDRESPDDRPEVWAVDPGRDGAVVRVRTGGAAGVHSDVDIRYAQSPHGWLPSGWTKSFTRPGQPPQVERTYRVALVSVNEPIPQAEFEPSIRPGQQFEVDGLLHVVRPDGTWEMDPAIARHLQREAFKARMLAMLLSPRTWVIAGLFTLLFTVAMVWRVIRSGRRTPAPLDPA
jgi:hypothetical protein